MSVKDDLIAAKALIDTPEKWRKDAFGSQGCYCTAGALRVVVGENFESTLAWAVLWRNLPKGSRGVVSFNDDPATTHADIMALFDRAIDAAQAS